MWVNVVVYGNASPLSHVNPSSSLKKLDNLKMLL